MLHSVFVIIFVSNFINHHIDVYTDINNPNQVVHVRGFNLLRVSIVTVTHATSIFITCHCKIVCKLYYTSSNSPFWGLFSNTGVPLLRVSLP